ncbi:MAG: hypothetical protein JWR35_874 [Marmoricola sp.]|jgi:pimeloyl-ACP methyl ester carboxylesterase|nr:hypothetical protein [Marmoricola sp.]
MHTRLFTSDVPADPQGIVLMLHGGAEHSERPVDRRNGALVRSRMMFQTMQTRVVASDHVLCMLRFSVKGWNAGVGHEPSPVVDARWALDHLRREFADLPVVLLGHSMGGRAAIHVADDPSVVGVVGLAPWWSPQDPIDTVAGKHLVAAHGSRDRITSAKQTRRYLQRADGIAASTKFVDMGFIGHYMLTNVKHWNRVACKESLAAFEPAPSDEDCGSHHVGGITPPN